MMKDLFSKEKTDNTTAPPTDMIYEDSNSESLSSELVAETMPIASRIGFYEAGISKKEVMQAIRNTAINDFGTLSGVYYNVIKYNGGFLYEIHHGCSLGVLKEIISKVSTQDLALETNDATYKIYVKSNSHVSMLKLRPDDPNIDKFEKLTPKDTLKPIESSGYGFYVFGVGVAILGVLALSLSSLVKHVFIDQEQAIMYEQSGLVFPSDYINSIHATMDTLTEKQYILSVSYSEADGWSDKIGTTETFTSEGANEEPVYFSDGEIVDIYDTTNENNNEENK